MVSTDCCGCPPFLPAFASPSFCLSPQPELDQAAPSAEPVAQREATAALSHGMDPLAQSHCYSPLAFSPSSTRRPSVERPHGEGNRKRAEAPRKGMDF